MIGRVVYSLAFCKRATADRARRATPGRRSLAANAALIRGNLVLDVHQSVGAAATLERAKSGANERADVALGAAAADDFARGKAVDVVGDVRGVVGDAGTTVRLAPGATVG